MPRRCPVAPETQIVGQEIRCLLYSLSANVENSILLGNAAIDGTGNILNNSITGNDADNILKGVDGIDTKTCAGGNDTLIGGVGND